MPQKSSGEQERCVSDILRDIRQLNDDQILQLCKAAKYDSQEQLESQVGEPEWSHLLTDVVSKKCSSSSEVSAMVLVRRKLKSVVPVPKVFRTSTDGGNTYVLMHRIKGRPLDSCWDEMNFMQKVRIARKLRGYVRQLRQLRTTQIQEQVPGPLCENTRKPQVCNGWINEGENVGPFYSKAEMVKWFNGQLRRSYDFHDPGKLVIPFDETQRLVFVHGNLSMKNIIVDNEDRLWLTEFGKAGIYPRWFEYFGMKGWQSKLSRRRARWLKKFVAGSYEDQAKFMRQVGKIPRQFSQGFSKLQAEISERNEAATGRSWKLTPIPEIRVEDCS